MEQEISEIQSKSLNAQDHRKAEALVRRDRYVVLADEHHVARYPDCGVRHGDSLATCPAGNTSRYMGA